jgi:phosphosulfolactate synthase
MQIQSFSDALGLTLTERTKKPREYGITMVIDVGHTWQELNDVLDAYGECIDAVKLAGENLPQPVTEIAKKTALLRAHHVEAQPGGIIIEVARWQKKTHEVLTNLKEIGFTQIEVSSSATALGDMSEEEKVIRLARDFGFKVYGEVGKKFAEGDKTRKGDSTIDLTETINEMKSSLSAGAEHVYWEGHLLRRLMGETPNQILERRDMFEPVFERIDREVGAKHVVFEVSAMCPYVTRRSMQFWLIRMFGPNVNIGNVKLHDVPILEHTRQGIYPIFGFGPAGDHPWINSISKRDGKEGEKWWQEFPAVPTPAFLDKPSEK